MASPNHPRVSTLALFGYLATVLSVELEIGLICLQIFSPRKPGLTTLTFVLLLSVGLATFVIFRGKHDFARLHMTRGRIELSFTQIVLVTVFMVLFGGLIGLIAQNM